MDPAVVVVGDRGKWCEPLASAQCFVVTCFARSLSEVVEGQFGGGEFLAQNLPANRT
jgi:hypothetical protein